MNINTLLQGPMGTPGPQGPPGPPGIMVRKPYFQPMTLLIYICVYSTRMDPGSTRSKG